MGAVSPQATPGDLEVAAAVRLLHRRHGWRRAARTGFVAFVLAQCACVYAAGQGTPVPDWFEYIVLAVGALTLACIVTSVICRARVRHTPPAILARATPLAAGHPAGSRAHHYPPRHRISWILGWVGMLLILAVAVISVSGPVDGVAYLAGAERTATFVPVSYQTNCSQYGCQTSTEGFLQTNGADNSATWPDVVALGRSFQVRVPAWQWGLGGALIDSDGIAIFAITISLLIEAAGILVAIRLVRLARNWTQHQQAQRRAQEVPARVS